MNLKFYSYNRIYISLPPTRTSCSRTASSPMVDFVSSTAHHSRPKAAKRPPHVTLTTSPRRAATTTPPTAHHELTCRLSSTPSPTADFSSAPSGTPTPLRRPRCPRIRRSPHGSSRHPRSARRGHRARPRSRQRPPQQTRAKGTRRRGASWGRGSGRARP